MEQSSLQNESLTNNWTERAAFTPMSQRVPYKTTQHARHPPGYRKRPNVPSKTMVLSAIKTLARSPRVGVSFQAIKKFIAEKYQDTVSPQNNRFHFIKKYIKKSLEKGELVRTKGVGLTGSFRLPNTKQTSKKNPKSSGIKNKKKHKKKMLNTNRQKPQKKPMNPKGLNNETLRAKETSGDSDGAGGDADELLSIAQEKAMQPTSKPSLRKVHISN